jgi:uncharacterized protein YggE
MSKTLSVFALAIVSHLASAQVGGNAVYGQDRSGGPHASERAKRVITKDEMPPNARSMFLDASVLINVKADQYVAIFGVSQEGATLEEARRKMDTAIEQFTQGLRRLGVRANDLNVDFVAQNRIYGFELTGDVARERLTGFEVKKNVSIRYRDKALLDQYIAAAATLGIFDLIKVDYIVTDIVPLHARLMEEATRVVKRKAASHARLLGIQFQQPPQIYAERYSSYFPSEMYESYTAQETEDVGSNFYRQRYTVQGARKSRTFYFNPLNAKNFDHVVNPVVVEPVVQFTLYLKLRYATGSGTDARKPNPALRLPTAPRPASRRDR